MKKYLLLYFFGIITISISFKESDRSMSAKEIEKELSLVKDGLYFSKYETSNEAYRSFLADLKRTENLDAWQANQLDTTKWVGPNSVNEPYIVYYHSHMAYNNYPVVTVSFESANNYCKWLTSRYNADEKRKYKKVIFRLPTQQEWEYAASGGKKERQYPWDGKYLRNKKGIYLANFKRVNDAHITRDPIDRSIKILEDEVEKWGVILSENHSFYPNEFGLYNMAGNAAEMVAEKGIAKGGSYLDPGYDVRIASEKKYSNATADIGFRVVMELVEK